LEIFNFQTSCSLTADEKVIMWESVPFAEGGLKRIFVGMRPSILHSFSNFREAIELEDIKAYVPRMSPDGLSVYFKKIEQ